MQHGALLAGLGGCAACHTAEDGPPYAGGYAIETEFGVFYGPNLTPDPVAGIGGWSESDFITAMRHGRSPQGRPLWPAFPYPSFTGMTDADLRDIFAFLQAVPASDRPSQPHALRLLYRGRWKAGWWKLLAFRTRRFEPDPSHDAQWNRGAYLGTAVGHCGECHSPRSAIGKVKRRRALGGTSAPPEPGPNLTPHPDALGDWSASDWDSLLTEGMTPDGDFVGAGMRAVVEHGTASLSVADRAALIVWLRALPAVTPRRSKLQEDSPQDGFVEEW